MKWDILKPQGRGNAVVDNSFIGEFHHSLDAKGRLIVPASFRDGLGSSFRVGISLDPCLTVYSNEGWEEFYARLSALPGNRQETRRVIRFFTSGTVRVELDRQGRILLPQEIRDKAGIKKDVVFLGFGSKAEIWDEATYEAYQNDNSREAISDIASKLQDEGFSI